jgi:hypothetical protein
MFASQMIGPVAETARQDRQREHTAEWRHSQARESARETPTGAGGDSWASATAAWLTRVYLPPVGPVGRTRPQGSSCQVRHAPVAWTPWASAAAWVSRVVGWLSDRRARTATP